jgi:hypothetical protein
MNTYEFKVPKNTGKLDITVGKKKVTIKLKKTKEVDVHVEPFTAAELIESITLLSKQSRICEGCNKGKCQQDDCVSKNMYTVFATWNEVLRQISVPGLTAITRDQHAKLVGCMSSLTTFVALTRKEDGEYIQTYDKETIQAAARLYTSINAIIHHFIPDAPANPWREMIAID